MLARPGMPKQLVVANTGGVTIYEPDTGKVIADWVWHFGSMRPQRTVGSPVSSGGLVYATSGDGSGTRYMVALRIEDDGRLTKAWETKRDMPYVPTMLTVGERLYWVNDTGFAGCADARTGTTIWLERLGEPPVFASPVLVNGKIYAATEHGHVFVLQTGDTYKKLATNSLGEAIVATPAVANGRMFIRGRDHLFCIGVADQKGRTAAR